MSTSTLAHPQTAYAHMCSRLLDHSALHCYTEGLKLHLKGIKTSLKTDTDSINTATSEKVGQGFSLHRSHVLAVLQLVNKITELNCLS